MEPDAAIGEWQTEDWRLEPREEAKMLPPEARQLINVLTSPELDAIKRSHDLADREAVSAQIEYKSSGRRAVWLYSAAAIFGALVLYASTEAPAGSLVATVGTKIRIPLLILQALSLGGAAYFSYLLRENAPFERWMDRRAAAELDRRRLFEQVVSASPRPKENADEIDLLPLQLEYFRRYHLETQLQYFIERSEHHDRAARRLVTGGALLAFLTTVAVALGGLASDLGQWIAPVALIGVSAPVLVAANGNLKLLSQDRRNAVRYRNAADKLFEKQRAITVLRSKARAGEATDLRKFFSEVCDIIGMENSEWLALLRKDDQRPQFSALSGSPPQPASKPAA